MTTATNKQKETEGKIRLPDLFEPYVWAWFKDTFKSPSPPQVASWPKIAEGKHTLIFSPTGSGKTLAAFLWCINELFKMGHEQALEDTVYVLYISPLKALNNDIHKNLVEPLQGIQAYAKQMGFDVPEVRSAVRTGDTTQRQRAAMARRPPHIFITTPESLYIILATQKFREALRSVRYVIVDEIHAMSDNKRGVHLSLSLERLAHLVSGQAPMDSGDPQDLRVDDPFVRIGLSATQKPLDEIAHFLTGVDNKGVPRPCEIVDVGARKNLDVEVLSPVDNLLEAHFDAIWGTAYDQILTMIRNHDTTLVFTNSRYKTERTSLRLNELAGDDSIVVGAHHGSMSKKVRLTMENKLKKGALDALVATSSLELGIDVGSIDLVCQIQSPKSVSSGMQRIGRAGHLLDATSKGRLLVTDRDDLVESAVLVKAIVEGQIDTTRIPLNCLDVLAQQIVGAVAADPWPVDALFQLCRHAYCYWDLDRADFERVLDMLSGTYNLEMEYAPYPKINWDKVNNVLYPEPGARLIAFRASGTIPDISEFDVYHEARKTVVGRLSESFVEELHTGDIFILGSSAWRVLGIRRNRVLVEDVYGKAPTIPFWYGERASRTYDLGLMVGAFRRAMAARMARHPAQDPDGDVFTWLKHTYHVNEDGAAAIIEYFREQQLITGDVPSDALIVIEQFSDELGHLQIVIHASFGIRVNDPWAMALGQAIEEVYDFRPIIATVDDGILISIPKDVEEHKVTGLLGIAGHEGHSEQTDPHPGLPLRQLVTPENLDGLLVKAVLASSLFKSRFRHNAVRAMMVLREYKGRRTPVWLQGLRASGLLAACQTHEDFPLIVETLRECMHEALDVPNLRKVIEGLSAGEIAVKSIVTQIPSPFTHSLLLLGQYGELGSIPTQERRSRLMHLHRELLRQILDEETLRHLLDEAAVQEVDDRLQRRHPKRARNANELARLLLELGDLVMAPDDEISLLDRVDGPIEAMLDTLVFEHRAILVPIPTAETHAERWIATENLPLYRAAFATPAHMDEEDQHLLEILAKDGPLTLNEIPCPVGIKDRQALGIRLDKLRRAYQVLRVVRDWRPAYVAVKAWVPEHILAQEMPREDARLALVQKFTRWHGPVTKYEIMERYGLPGTWVEHALATLHDQGSLARGEYVPTKSFPQWCYKPNLEEIHRLTLNRLRKEMEPAMPEVFADFLLRWQHRHPETQLEGLDGLRTIIGQIQGQENYQIVYERDLFYKRIRDYKPAMLDRLCQSGEVVWRRFDPKRLKRGYIGFCFRRDQHWVAPPPDEVTIKLHERWGDDIPEVVATVKAYIREHGACFFDDIVEGTGLDWRLVLRAVWRLVWMGEATNDAYESIRYADVASGLSACYDLANHPGKKGVTLEMIVRHILENRHLDPRLGRWAPTERLVPPTSEALDVERTAEAWGQQLLRRYGIVSREMLKRECAVPKWRDIRRSLLKLELMGKVRRGFFVEGLSGEQYATPEAVEALRAAKLRQPDRDNGLCNNNDLVLVNMLDPANPFGYLFPVTNTVGNEIKVMRTPTKYLVLQAGRPIMLYEDRITVLDDLSRATAEAAIRLLMGLVDGRSEIDSRKDIHVRQWNYHPTDVSPARHLLLKLGFTQVRNRHKLFVYDGTPTDAAAANVGDQELLDVYERVGKEKAPIVYDADWVISQAHEVVRPKVAELIPWLQARVPPECEFIYRPRYFRDFQVLYRGMRCINPHVQQKKIWLQITHKGWTRGMQILPDTDINDPAFVKDFEAQFARTREEIDKVLAGDKK